MLRALGANMIALAFFAGIFLTAAVAILIVRGAKAPHADKIDLFDCRAGLPPFLRESPIKPTALDDDRMRSLSVKTPVTDWDVARAAEQEPHPPLYMYGVTGEER